jgi:hypothetical protein
MTGVSKRGECDELTTELPGGPINGPPFSWSVIIFRVYLWYILAMARTEQADRIRIEVSKINSLDMDVMGGVKHGLGLTEHRDFSTVPEEGMDLLKTVMVAHLIAPFFPRIVETNFGISQKEFIDELYKYYGYEPPKLIKLPDQVETAKTQNSGRDVEKIEVASAHSGGMDSAYRLATMMKEDKKVLAVHLRNLNNKGNYGEVMASREQCQKWGVPYEEVHLRNSSGNNGFETMRTRDFLLAIVAAVTAYPYGVNKVIIEGGMFDDPKKGHFSENTAAWRMFNKLLADAQMKMEVEGIDPGDVETVGEVIKLEKELGIEIIPLIQNCFCTPFQRPGVRRKWNRETPVISANSSEHWCGSCIKCRRMTLGRLFYHDPRLATVPESEVKYFVEDTYDWMKKYEHNKDMISPSFLKHLEELKR